MLSGESHYNPEIGRWMSKDPVGFLGKDANLYRYVGNSPMNYVDPSGLIINDPSGFTLSDEFLSSDSARNLATTLDRSSTTYNIIDGFSGVGRYGATDTRSINSDGSVNIYVNSSKASSSGVNSVSSTLYHELLHSYIADRGRVDSNFNDFNRSGYSVESYIRNKEKGQFGVQCEGK